MAVGMRVLVQACEPSTRGDSTPRRAGIELGGGSRLGCVLAPDRLHTPVGTAHEKAMSKRARLSDPHGLRTWVLPLLAGAAIGRVAATAAADFERPPDEPPAASLPADEVSGPDFHIEDPVHSDGLMHHYVIRSRFGVFTAYGPDALRVRLREVAALSRLAQTSQTSVVVNSVVRELRDEARTVLQVARNPISAAIDVPKGIAHLLSGYGAQAQEATHQAARTDSAAQAGEEARRYAESFLGVTAAERRWSQRLAVDPYTDNQVLRRAVTRLARVDAAASFSLLFTPVGIAEPVHQALEAVYQEDPALLRKRQRAALAAMGLTPAEIEHFQNTLLLSPTRQTLLIDAAGKLAGVTDRTELLRHAASVTTEEEIELFLQSMQLLLQYHAHEPIARILPGVRIPAAQLRDGRIVVFGAFDAVYWTADVAAYERALRAALPEAAPGRLLVLEGTASARAQAELARLGWQLQQHATLASLASAALTPRAAHSRS
jgi:hypothetical protein